MRQTRYDIRIRYVTAVVYFLQYTANKWISILPTSQGEIKTIAKAKGEILWINYSTKVVSVRFDLIG